MEIDLKALSKFTNLVNAGGDSGGEAAARRLAEVILARVPDLDEMAIEGVIQFVRLTKGAPETAAQLIAPMKAEKTKLSDPPATQKPDPEAEWPWYLSVKALGEFMQIMGYSGQADDSNPVFTSVEKALGALTTVAREVGQRSPDSQGNLIATFRTVGGVPTLKGKRTRLEFSVSFSRRDEGHKPQLVAVRDKGARGAR